MKASKLFLFFRNTLIAYISIGVLAALFSLSEGFPSIYSIGNTLIFGGIVIATITIWVVFKPMTRTHIDLSLANFNPELFKKRRVQEKPTEFIAFSVLLACGLIITTGFLIFKIY